MPIPQGNRVDLRKTYRDYWGTLDNDEAKLRYLLMLKERRDTRRDVAAAEVLRNLVSQWLEAVTG